MLEMTPYLALVAILSDPRPQACEVQRLPHPGYLLKCLEQNEAYQTDLQFLVKGWPHYPNVRNALCESEKIERFLRLAIYVHQQNDPYEQRVLLQDIRQLLGSENFYRGNWPAAIPWWRLPRHP